MTTIPIPTDLVEATTHTGRLDQHVARMVSDEPTLTDIASVLHLLGITEDIDGCRVQTLCFMAARALGKFSSDVRSAPPHALNTVVHGFAADTCKAAHLGCLNTVTAWTSEDGFCTDSCRVAHMANQGETWVDN